MTVVVGTAGHIDHGKSTLLRALTGIDPDRLPDEQRRGMTIDVGYAHLTLPDGRAIDFVDVPGHDRLVGNMLVGAGEIDAVLLVIAADDGPRAQTLEHLALLDALGIDRGVVAITKADLVGPDRLAEVAALVRVALAPTGLVDAPALAVSSTSGQGLDELRTELGRLAEAIGGLPVAVRPPRLSVDRAFLVHGRGVVVTGSLRGGPVAAGQELRLLPGGGRVRIREIQVHGSRVAVAVSGRTAFNLAGVELADVARGAVLAADASVVATDRLLVALSRPRVADAGRRGPAWPPRDGARARLHLGTDDLDAAVGRGGRDGFSLPDGRPIAVVRLSRPVAAAAGDRFVLRRSSPGTLLAGGVVLDVRPTRGVSRRRQTVERVTALAVAMDGGDPLLTDAAHLDLHGVVAIEGSVPRLAPDVRDGALGVALDAVDAWHAAHPGDAGMPLSALRPLVGRALRRAATVSTEMAAAGADLAIGAAVRGGELLRDGDRLRRPEHRRAAPDPALEAAMDRLEAALAGVAPPPLAATASRVGCPPAGIRALETAGRIVVLEPDLAWTAGSYQELAARAVVMAHAGPLSPATFRDATGTSRRYTLAILEDLDRRGVLRRTDAGHVPGAKAPPLPGSPVSAAGAVDR